MTRREGARRRKPSPARTLRPFWFLMATFALLIGGALYGLAVWPAFYPHSIDVEGNRVVARDAILAAAQIDAQRNIWLQDTHAVARRIDAIPYIATAFVHRRPPGAMVIVVTERTPYAMLTGTGGTATVDHAMRILQAGVPADRANSLPALRLDHLPAAVPGTFVNDADLLGLVQAEDALLVEHLDARALDHDRFGDVEVTLRSGIRVLLGDGTMHLEQKVAMIEPILEKVDRGRRKVAAIDLRAPTTPVVVYAK
jgi:cell division protein FtsQ